MKMLALTNPKNAVTVSNISLVLWPQDMTERHPAPHSQKDSRPAAQLPPG
jgi:hypothetical protein